MYLPARPMASERRRPPSGCPGPICRQTEYGNPRSKAARCGVSGTSSACGCCSNRRLPCSRPVYRVTIAETSCAASNLPFSGDPNSLWGDSAFAGLINIAFLESAGCQTHIHKKGTRNLPLSVDAKARNSMRTMTRVRVEHVLGRMVMTMKGKYTRLIGINLVTAWWGLGNLTFNFLRFIHTEQQQSVPA